MVKIDYKFIFGVLIFYGFLFLLISGSGGNLFGLEMENEITFSVPAEPSGNAVIDFLNGTYNLFGNIWSFFMILFITPLSTSYSWLGFINWAIFGTIFYLLIKMVRGN